MKSLKSFKAPLDLDQMINVRGGELAGKTRDVYKSKDINGHTIDKCVDFDTKTSS